jgi:hypothetical protein
MHDRTIRTRDHTPPTLPGVIIGTDRPYPATGIDTATWRTQPTRIVDVHDLTTTQDGVRLDGLLTGRTRSGSDDYPHVVVWDGRLYLEDGHTRVARAVLRYGVRHIRVRVFEHPPIVQPD